MALLFLKLGLVPIEFSAYNCSRVISDLTLYARVNNMNLAWFTLSRIGLIYDIAGAIILVSSNLRSGKKELKEAELFSRDKINIRKIVFEKIDTVFAIFIIALGFLGQLVGSDHAISQRFNSSCTGPITSLVILSVFIAAFFIFRIKLGRMYYEINTKKKMQL